MHNRVFAPYMQKCQRRRRYSISYDGCFSNSVSAHMYIRYLAAHTATFQFLSCCVQNETSLPG